MKWPRIRSRRTTAVSPWMSIVAREVEFSRGETPQIYHAVEQADYISIVALTPGGKIPIVRQYRPALEAFSWELPAGLLDPGESPADACRRELLEETGLTARTIHPLGENSPCTGRLDNRIHSFFVEAGDRIKGFKPEAGITVKLVSPAEVGRLITERRFRSPNSISAPCCSRSCVAFWRCRAQGKSAGRRVKPGAHRASHRCEIASCSRDHLARYGQGRAQTRRWRDALRSAG